LSGALASRTLARAQLLRSYPQFTGVSVISPTIGSSTYHSLQGEGNRFSRTASGGLAVCSAAPEWCYIESAIPAQNNSTSGLRQKTDRGRPGERRVAQHSLQSPVGGLELSFSPGHKGAGETRQRALLRTNTEIGVTGACGWTGIWILCAPQSHPHQLQFGLFKPRTRPNQLRHCEILLGKSSLAMRVSPGNDVVELVREHSA